MKKENYCNNKLIRLLFNYVVFLLVAIACGAAVLILDGYLKTFFAHRDMEQATKNHEYLVRERKVHSWSFNIVPDYRLEFSLA